MGLINNYVLCLSGDMRYVDDGAHLVRGIQRLSPYSGFVKKLLSRDTITKITSDVANVITSDEEKIFFAFTLISSNKKDNVHSVIFNKKWIDEIKDLDDINENDSLGFRLCKSNLQVYLWDNESVKYIGFHLPVAENRKYLQVSGINLLSDQNDTLAYWVKTIKENVK